LLVPDNGYRATNATWRPMPHNVKFTGSQEA